MIKNARLGASANPTGGACRPVVVVPQRMPRLEEHRDKRIKHQPGQGRGIGDQAEEQSATPAEGLHAVIVHSLSCSPQDVVCVLLTTHASRYGVGHATDALSEHLSLQASPSRGGALGFSMVVVGFFVFLHGLPENRADFFEMLDAFMEFSRFSHQHSVASLQFLKAQAQRFLLALRRVVGAEPWRRCP